uniref:Gamma-secretase subunit APH-1 n=1 Tax=Accipiter nisus TaxID=211598 RepID=A0A8B9NLH4_9AVES
MTMVLIFLHTFWGILFFHGCEHRRWWEIMAVVVMHLAVSGSTFCNPLYVGSLVPSYLLMAAAAAWAYLLSGGSAQNLWRFLLCKSCSIKGRGDPVGPSGYQARRWDGEGVSPGLEQSHHPFGCQTGGEAGFWGCGLVVASPGGSGWGKESDENYLLSSWCPQVYGVEPAPSRDPETLRDVPVPSHPSPPLHTGSKEWLSTSLQYLFSCTGGPWPVLLGQVLGSSCGSQPTHVAGAGLLQRPFGSAWRTAQFWGTWLCWPCHELSSS